MRVLVTRPRQDGEAIAIALRAAGHEALLAPLLETRFVEGPPLDLSGVAAILATSANGVRAFAARQIERDLPLFAVGPQSAAAARQAGFARVEEADGDAQALARAVPGWIHPEAGVLLHASGRDSSGALAARLEEQGFGVRREILYAVEALPMDAAAATALAEGRLDGALFFSPRSARIFRESLAAASLEGAPLGAAFCISAATAAALRPLAFRAVHVAARPNQDALLALLGPA